MGPSPEGARYRLTYHPAVAREDVPRIPPRLRPRIARAIEQRVATSPERLAVPLRGTLRGYWKLRVGHHRVVFRIAGEAVLVLAIGHRRDVYGAAARRF